MASSTEFPLPLELLCEIIELLPLTDLQTLSLVSRLTRSQAIRFLFGHLRYTTRYSQFKIHQARKDVKEAIKKLELTMPVTIFALPIVDKDLVIFQFLKTLPNLQVLNLSRGFLPPAYLSRFISSIRHTALLELVFQTVCCVGGLPTAGLAGLEKLSIGWYSRDHPNEPGSSLAHLYELIRPTLTKLVHLKIDTDNTNEGIDDFDLQLLKPAADTLRIFEYALQSADESILDTIPAIFTSSHKAQHQMDQLTLESSPHFVEGL